MLDIVTVGDIKWDTFLVIPHASVQCMLRKTECQLCIEYGKKIPIQSSHAQIAGSAPNVAVAAAKMRLKSAVVSVMGKDITHTLAMDFLKRNGVSTAYIRTTAHRNSSFAAVLNFRGESTQLVVHHPVDYSLPRSLPKAQWLHLSELGTGYGALLKDAVAYAKRVGVRLSVNPGQIQLAERKPAFFALLKEAEVLFLNLHEARELLGMHTAAVPHVLAKLYELGPDDVVVTDGQRGAYAYDGKQLWHAPMFPGKRVEATGAGDGFAAGYLGALLHRRGAEEALCWGSVNAASVVGAVGPTAGLLSHTEIRRRLAARPSYTAALV